jgi:hypothetical protein
MHHHSVFVSASFTLIASALVFSGPSPAAAASDCVSGATADVDGGGSDVVIGVPSYDLPDKQDAGAIVVFSNVQKSSGSDPESPSSRTVITADDVGLDSQAGARFGASVALWGDSLDLDDPDFCSDIVVGAPGEDVGSHEGAGRVHLLKGANDGITSVVRSFDEDSLSEVGGAQDGAAFGSALAAETQQEIAVGAPGRDVDGAEDAGRVVEIKYQAVNVPGTPNLVQQGNGSAGAPEPGDRLGEVLLLTPTGDGPILFIGAPHEDIGSKVDAGSIYVLDNTNNLQGVNQDSPGAAGGAEAGDNYGAALDLFFTAGPVATIGIGVPGEDISGRKDVGSVSWAKFALSSVPEEQNGPLLGTNFTTDQDSPGVPGGMEAGDRFGSSLSLGEFGQETGGKLLMVGAPGEDVGSVANAGMAGLSRVGEDGSPLSGSPSIGWNQESDNVPGASETNDRFGATLGHVRLARAVDDDDSSWQLAVVTVPGEDIGGVSNVGSAYVGVPQGGRSVPLNFPFSQTGTGDGMVGMPTPW